MNIPRSAIRVNGHVDTKYLGQALRRAGRVFDADDLALEKLNGGRTGAQVHRLVAGNESYVIKQAPIASWQQSIMKSQGEGPLWLSGVLDRLPDPLECPIMDTVYHDSHEAWWILMRDVSAGIRPRGAFGAEETLKLWRSIARLHAAYWGNGDVLENLPLVDVAETTRLFSAPVSCAAGREAGEEWAPRVVEEFMPLRMLLPIFLDLLDPDDADFYLEMTQNRSWHKGLDDATPTLLHGDLRRANIAFMEDRVVLFDWEFAARGPAACDLQWSSFLTFWAYTPDDGRQPWDLDDLRNAYLEELETQLGGKIDRAEFHRTWGLGWVRIVSMLGFCFADANLDDPDERAVVRKRATTGLQWCRRVLDE